jgi:hypothetical protein
MITQVENTEARRYFAGFITQCTTYKSLLTTAGLPVSVDMDVLTGAYRQQLFDGLLKVDKGLKARYELLRTDDARAKLIADTINLDGHDVIDDAAAALQQLARTYQQVQIPGEGPLHRDMPLESFARYHNLDFGQLLDAHTLSWAGNEHVKAYFDNLATALTPWLAIVRKTMKSGATVEDAGQLLGQYFTASIGGLASEQVMVQEKVLYHRMKSQKLDQHIFRA